MYEELLPLWKNFCYAESLGKGYDPHVNQWSRKLTRLGLTWEWCGDNSSDCLVLGVILFTREAGLEP